jgi:hypothetical protein
MMTIAINPVTKRKAYIGLFANIPQGQLHE